MLARLKNEQLWLQVLLGCGLLGLLVGLVLPLYSLFIRSLRDRQDQFVGLDNYIFYLQSGGITDAAWNSLWVAMVSMVIVVSLSFMAAYGLSRTRLPGKGLFRSLLTLPILAPSLLPAISLIYLFGNQGMFKSWLFGHSIYGPLGIILGSVFWTFPHALMILMTALSQADARQYEAAQSLKASAWRTFWTVTVPGARYGLVSAAFVVFTLVITDFGVAKVVGGQFNVLATDIYKNVIGQQRFDLGAVIGVILLLPAILAFAADRWVQKKQAAAMTARSVPYQPKASVRGNFLGLGLISPSLLFILLIIGMAIYASLVTYWPYNLDLTLRNYQFVNFDPSGWQPYFNSLKMATMTMVFGTVAVFFNAWLVERCPQSRWLKNLYQLLALLPMAVPGLVLGLAYIFFFNHPNNPLNGLYGGLVLMALCSLIHFYSVSHLTSMTALKQLDSEFEAVGDSLKSSRLNLFRRLTLPLSLPAILDIALYLFVNAMTTVSAVIFIYGHNSRLASIMILSLEEAGGTGAAAAMSVVIMLTCGLAKLIHSLLSMLVQAKSQAWKIQTKATRPKRPGRWALAMARMNFNRAPQ